MTKSGKTVKSAKVVGHVIGSYHPHGDVSCYQTIVKLAAQGYVATQGNFGSVDLKSVDPPAAQRYTECKIAKWVKNLAFKYYHHVPWLNIEYENEPLYLPSIIPLGLIGIDNLSGSGFHKCLSPKYSMKDLLTRLKWILENQNKITTTFVEDLTNEYSEDMYGPCIKPAFRNCECKEDSPGTFYKILVSGVGKCRAIPFGEIKNGEIHVNGKAPTFNSTKLEQDIDSKEPGVNPGIKQFKDLSTSKKDPFFINGVFTPKNKSVNIQQLYIEIFKKYFIKSFTYQCYFVKDHVATLLGIDQILINNYVNYINTVKTYKISQTNKLIDSLFTTNILIIVRDIIQRYTVTTIDDIVNVFNQDNIKRPKTLAKDRFDEPSQTWATDLINVTEEVIIDVCSSKSIKQLIEFKQNIVTISQKIVVSKQEIIDVGNSCYYELCDLLTKQK